MTEPKSPREIAEDITQWRAMFTLDQYRDQTRAAIEQALLSYVAERERLLSEADAVIECGGQPPVKDVLIYARWLNEALARHKSRLSSRPATEGKGDD